MQVFASSRGVTREMIHECTRIAFIAPPPLRGGDFNQVMPAAFGVFRGVDVPESLLDEPLDDLPFVEFFFRYAAGSYCMPPGQRVPPQWLRAA